MPDVFIDTGGWVCHLDASQPQHADTSTLVGVCLAKGRRFVISNYVLAELVAVLTTRRRIPRADLIRAVETVRNWEHLTVVYVDAVLDAAA